LKRSAAAFAPEPVYAFIAIFIAAIGIWSTFGLIWAYAGDLVAGPARQPDLRSSIASAAPAASSGRS
jgi:hypothetical protein